MVMKNLVILGVFFINLEDMAFFGHLIACSHAVAKWPNKTLTCNGRVTVRRTSGHCAVLATVGFLEWGGNPDWKETTYGGERGRCGF